MQKTVTSGMRNTTVTLDGTECAVKFSANYRYFEVANESGGDVTVSVFAGKNQGDDGALTVHSGTSATLAHMRNDISTLYLKGSGTVQIAAKNSGEPVFKSKAKGGENVNLKVGSKLDYYKIESSWIILTSGLAKANAQYDILYYDVTPHSVIYIKAADDANNECKFVWLNYENVSSTNTYNIVGDPVTAVTDGFTVVPEGAKYIGFSRLKTDEETGVYKVEVS